MANLWSGIFQKNVCIVRHRRDVRTAVVACDAILLILSAQKARRTTGVMRSVAGVACIGSHGCVTAELGLRRNLACGKGMRAGGPVNQGIDQAAHRADRVMAGQAKLAA